MLDTGIGIIYGIFHIYYIHMTPWSYLLQRHSWWPGLWYQRARCYSHGNSNTLYLFALCNLRISVLMYTICSYCHPCVKSLQLCLTLCSPMIMWPWANYFTFLVLSLPFAKIIYICLRGFTCGASGKESACHCRRHKRRGFNSWVGKIPWRRAWQPTPIFLLGEFHGQKSLVGCSP